VTLYVLDSDTHTLLVNQHPKVSARVRAVAAPNVLATTVITVVESVLGWNGYIRRARTPAAVAFAFDGMARSIEVLAGFRIIGFSVAASARYDQLDAMKLNVGKNDLRIAAIALEAGATVVTRNLREFQRVPGLVCEDWAV
jgi:tRNA(fMet)-specific endonuclease VapC